MGGQRAARAAALTNENPELRSEFPRNAAIVPKKRFARATDTVKPLSGTAPIGAFLLRERRGQAQNV
jgi:hypothetical protein